MPAGTTLYVTLSVDNLTLRVEQNAGDGNDIIAAQIAAINRHSNNHQWNAADT